MVVVFTKYDRLLISKKDEFPDQGNEKAEEAYDTCVQSLEKIVNGIHPPMPVPIFVKVSGIISHSLYDQRHG